MYENNHPIFGMIQENLKANVDLVAIDTITSIKNQIYCGSRWALSTIDIIQRVVLMTDPKIAFLNNNSLSTPSRMITLDVMVTG
jgi:C1A family cysteine protease